jgi:hypothetical protein
VPGLLRGPRGLLSKGQGAGRLGLRLRLRQLHQFVLLHGHLNDHQNGHDWLIMTATWLSAL